MRCVRNIARETSNRLKKLLITDKSKVSAEIRGIRITDYSPQWPKSAELQSTDYSQDLWLQSRWNRQRTGVPQAAR